MPRQQGWSGQMMGREGAMTRTMGTLGDGDKDGKGVYMDDIIGRQPNFLY